MYALLHFIPVWRGGRQRRLLEVFGLERSARENAWLPQQGLTPELAAGKQDDGAQSAPVPLDALKRHHLYPCDYPIGLNIRITLEDFTAALAS